MRRAIAAVRWPSLLPLLLALASGAPRAADCIDWPKTLTWADFKGPVPADVTKAAEDAQQAHEKVGNAESDLKDANTELQNKQTERQNVIDERNKELEKIDSQFDPKIKQALEDRAKAAETPDQAKAKATDAVNANTKLDANAKASKLKKIDSDYKAAQKKFEDPANAKARETKLAGMDKAIGKLQSEKSAKREAVNTKYDKKLEPIDQEVERLKGKVSEKEGALKKEQDAEEEAQKALAKVEQAATSATPSAGKLQIESCGKIKDLPVKAIFCPDQSYVLPQAAKAGSPALLKHEQLHFDIAEKHARLIGQDIKKLIDAFNAKVDELNKCQPKDLNDALSKAKEQFFKDLAAAKKKGMADFEAEQAAYDHDPAEGGAADGSAHGTNEDNQKAWSDKIAKDLKPK